MRQENKRGGIGESKRGGCVVSAFDVLLVRDVQLLRTKMREELFWASGGGEYMIHCGANLPLHGCVFKGLCK